MNILCILNGNSHILDFSINFILVKSFFNIKVFLLFFFHIFYAHMTNLLTGSFHSLCHGSDLVTIGGDNVSGSWIDELVEHSPHKREVLGLSPGLTAHFSHPVMLVYNILIIFMLFVINMSL